MGKAIEPVSSVAEISSADVRPAPVAAPPPMVSRAPAEALALDLRLVIEPDEMGGYIYKTLDRRTGEIINQYPRETVVRMREEERYRAGKVVSALA